MKECMINGRECRVICKFDFLEKKNKVLILILRLVYFM